MPSHRLKQIETEYFSVKGYSVAGEETVIALPELDVCFDIGKAPDQVININNILLSHGHIDHAAGLAYYLSHRVFCGQQPGTIYLPEGIVDPVKQIIDAWGVLDGSRIRAEIIPVKDGDDFMLRRDLKLKVFDTNHNRNSVGYTLVEVRKKLKSEYYGKTGRELKELKSQGIDIEYMIEIPIVTYTGDTCCCDYSYLDYVKNSKVLIIECTFFEQDHIDRAKAGKHIHINNLADVLTKLNNEQIILTHLSQRTHIKDAKVLLSKKLPPEIMSKITILMGYNR
ncbi:MAG: MBL fold metallo-hydrolase [Sedimentisphaeraceae bacterium JB056]